ncbi:hypothetical protein [Rheinheimera sp. MM224]|uniref:hypothetical protein n=1 Tax=Rheinheimera sp. MM224 TaxID=3019969 RepID=UPI0021F845F9|nr:hypothetical protein [Rheinheimera sp. MM224]CAI3803151.1 hypothetical protein JAMGFMIE_03289 [Rheinheimera sp. MM224]
MVAESLSQVFVNLLGLLSGGGCLGALCYFGSYYALSYLFDWMDTDIIGVIDGVVAFVFFLLFIGDWLDMSVVRESVKKDGPIVSISKFLNSLFYFIGTATGFYWSYKLHR